MKKISVPIMLVCLALIVQSCTNTDTQEAKETSISRLSGAWEYVDQDGLFIASEMHFSWVIKNETTTKDSLTGLETSVQSIYAAGGTYSFTDSVFTWTYLYSTNPEEVGTTLQTVMAFEGNEVKYTFINLDGTLGDTGVARRIASR